MGNFGKKSSRATVINRPAETRNDLRSFHLGQSVGTAAERAGFLFRKTKKKFFFFNSLGMGSVRDNAVRLGAHEIREGARSLNNCDVLERRRTARLKFVESKRTKDSYTVSGDVINFNGPTAGLLRVADACVVLQHMSRTFVRSSYTVKMFVAGREVSFCATNCRARRDQILIKFGQRTPRYSDMLSVIDSVDGSVTSSKQTGPSSRATVLVRLTGPKSLVFPKTWNRLSRRS